MNWLPYVVTAAIWLLLLAAMVLRRDLWPFSHYPMFARYEAPQTMRFFRLLFVRPDGHTTALVAVEPNLADAFDREFGRAWPDATGAGGPREIVQRFWRDAVRHRPALREATHARVIMCLAQLGPRGGVKIAESPAYGMELGAAAV